MARDKQQQLEAAQRIRELRGPKPQPVIAEAIGVQLRTYQHWEEGDGIGWDNLEKLARYHRVSENYILHGDDSGITPHAGIEQRLERVEQQLAELLSRLPDPAAEIERETADADRKGSPRGAGTGSSARGSRRQGKAR